MDDAHPVKLPIHQGISRCLGHNGRLGDVCKMREKCARHVTISHRDEPWCETKPPYYQMCSDEKYLSFMEIAK